MFTRKEQLLCKYCPPETSLVEDFQAGDLICSGCGLVMGDRVIDVGAEWRTFSNDTLLNKSRVGAEESVLYDGMDLSTMVGQSGPSPVAYDETGERKYRNKKFLSSTQRTLVSGFKEIAEMGEKLNATRPVIEGGQLIFKKIQSKQALKGRSNEAIGAACLYVAYRNAAVPRTFKEICAVAKANKRDIGKCYKVISKVIGEVISQPVLVSYIPRFAAQLSLVTATEKAAHALVERFEASSVLSGRSPATVIALALLLAKEKETILEKEEKLKIQKPRGSTESTVSLMPQLASLGAISKATGAAETTIKDAYLLVRGSGGLAFADFFPFTDITPSETEDSTEMLQQIDALKSESSTVNVIQTDMIDLVRITTETI